MSLAMHSCSLWPSGGVDWEVLEGILHGLTVPEIAQYLGESTLAMDTKKLIAVAGTTHSSSHQTPATSVPRHHNQHQHNNNNNNESRRLTSNRISQPDFLWKFPLGSEEPSPSRDSMNLGGGSYNISGKNDNNETTVVAIARPPPAVSSSLHMAVSADSAVTGWSGGSPLPKDLVDSSAPLSRPPATAPYIDDDDLLLSEASRLPSAAGDTTGGQDELFAAAATFLTNRATNSAGSGGKLLNTSSSGNDETPTMSHSEGMLIPPPPPPQPRSVRPEGEEGDVDKGDGTSSPPPEQHRQQHQRSGRQNHHHHHHAQPTTPSTPKPPRIPTSAESLALVEYVREQQQLYTLLEKQYLPSPYLFVSCAALQMPLRDRIRLIELHYELNEGLAELWFGDRLSRIDVEDDDLIEVGHPGLLETSVKRQWRNLKRVCKFMSSAYRGRDGAYIPRDVPLPQAIEEVFVLPTETARIYTALVFGFEHRLDCASLEPLEVYELASLCSAIAACWCDGSELMLSETFVKACASLGKVLSDSRVVTELEGLILGEDADGPSQRLLRQIKDTFDEMQKAMSPSTTNNNNNNSTSHQQHHHQHTSSSGSSSHGHHQGAPQLPVASSTATLEGLDRSRDATPPPSDQDGPTIGSAMLQSSSSTTFAAARSHNSNVHRDPSVVVVDVPSTTASAPPPSSQQRHSSPPPTPAPRQQRYSRRVISEFKSIIRNVGRISTLFGTSEKLRDVFDRFHSKVYQPLLQLGQVDAGVSVASAAAAAATAAQNHHHHHHHQHPQLHHSATFTTAASTTFTDMLPQPASNGSVFLSAADGGAMTSAAAAVPTGGSNPLSYSTGGGHPSAAALGASDPTAASAELLLATLNGSIASFPTAQQYSVAIASMHLNTSGNNFSNTLLNTTTSSAGFDTSSPPAVGGGGGSSVTGGSSVFSAIGGGATMSTHAQGTQQQQQLPPLTNEDVILRAVEAKRYIRELSVLLADMSAMLPKLKVVSEKTHAELDEAAIHFFAVLRLYTQLLLAHDG